MLDLARLRLPAALLALAGAVGCATQLHDAYVPPEIPQPDLSGMEPLVSRVLRETRAAVVGYPDSADSWGRLGAACHAHGLLADAATCYRHAAHLAPAEFRWPYFLAVVRAAEQAPFEELNPLFDAASGIDPDYAPLEVRRGEAALERGEFAAALDAFKRAAELDPALAQAHRGVGQCELALDRPEAAVAALEQSGRLAPDDRVTFTLLSRAYSLLGRADAARAAAARSRQLRSDVALEDPLLSGQVYSMGASARHWFARGRENLERQEYQAALLDLRTVQRVRADDTDVLYLMARAYRGLGQPESATRVLLEALEIDPGHVPSRVEYSRILEEAGRSAEALQQLREAIDVAPEEPSVLDDLARALARGGDTEGAVRAYERLVTLVPDDPKIVFNLATLCLQREDLTGAERYFRQAILLSPDYADAHHRLGVVLERSGEADEAREHYREAVRISPGHPAGERLR